jgi:hypothetical protein
MMVAGGGAAARAVGRTLAHEAIVIANATAALA